MEVVSVPGLAGCLRCIPPQSEPLSSDVFIIEGKERFYVFDAGASDAAYEALAGLEKPVTFILSHFHRDHTANMSRLAGEVLGGARTCKYIGRGTRVDAPLGIEDGVSLLVQPCVSPHAPGCLILTVDRTCTLLGDLIYAQPGAGAGEQVGMLRTLKGVDTRYFILSHGEEPRLVEKESLLRSLKEGSVG
ncbi:MAG: MBL fold metallo-hydrolase [Clostridia bacterium]|nr:MBL fold metallo-hydrolase [Clostridia bacterium]